MILSAALLSQLWAAQASAGWFGTKAGSMRDEQNAFKNAVSLFQDSSANPARAAGALQNYVKEFPDSPMAADAQFLIGEAFMGQALDALKARPAPSALPMTEVRANTQSSDDFSAAQRAYQKVVGADEKGGLGASANYRLGELYYNQKNWDKAIETFQEVEANYPKSYIVPEALEGIIYSDLALDNFSQAQVDLTALGESFPVYLKTLAMIYTRGIIALHNGDYAAAETAFKDVETADSSYYLGLTYFLSKRPFLAASAFDKMIHDFPQDPLDEKALLLLGDSFFLSQDYDGAIAKYQNFLSRYPESPLGSAALFRIGSSYLEKGDYAQSRLNFQKVLRDHPDGFFAPLSQYLIGDSYLAENQPRDALFAYTKNLVGYPNDLKTAGPARYKLAWSRYQLGDYSQTVEDCRKFLSLYPRSSLAKDTDLILGNALKLLGRHDDAVAAFQNALDLDPNSEIAEQALFSILQDEFEQKAYSTIITSYQFIFRSLPPSQSKWRILSYLYAAEAYLSLNHAEEAKDIYTTVLKLYPDSPYAIYAQDGMAWAFTYEGEDEKALAARQKLQDMISLTTAKSTFSVVSSLGIADSLFNQRKYEYAYEIYDRFVKGNPQAPEMPQALYHEGLSLYHLRYYSQAVETWNKLIVGYPQSPEARQASFQAADTLFREQKYPEAVSAYQNIIHAYVDSPRLPLAHIRIAQAFFNQREDDQALKEIENFVLIFPKAPEALDALDILETIFDRSKTIDYKSVLDTLIQSAPSSPIAAEATFRLARRAFDNKDYATAADYFQRFSVNYTDHPKLGEAQFYLGESDFELKKYQEAIPALERYVNNFSAPDKAPSALFHLASCYYNLKKYQPAATNYQRLLDQYAGSDDQKPAEFNLALSYKALGEPDLAEQAYQKYAQDVGAKSPEARAAYWETFEIQRRQRDFDAALKTLDLLEGSAKDAAALLEVQYRRSALLGEMGRPDEELDALKKLAGMQPAANPFRLQGLIQLGEMYEKYGDFSDAASVYADLARNASGDLARQASKRAAAMRESSKSQASQKMSIPVNSGANDAPPVETPAGGMPGMQ